MIEEDSRLLSISLVEWFQGKDIVSTKEMALNLCQHARELAFEEFFYVDLPEERLSLRENDTCVKGKV